MTGLSAPRLTAPAAGRTHGGAIPLSENTGEGPDGGCCCFRLMMGI